MNIPNLDPEVLARIDARVARDGLPSREAAFTAALREWAPAPNESMLADTADAFVDALRMTGRPDRNAAVNRVFDVVLERLARINTVAPHDQHPARCAHHFLTRFEGSPTARKYLRELVKWYEAAVFSIPGYRGKSCDHPEVLGLRDDLVAAMPKPKPKR
jgi:hypothetical protein